MSRWFRFYDDVLDDPKVQRLSPHLFKTWMNLLCLASKHNGKLPSNDDIAFCLRMSVQDAAQHVDDLILAGLIDIDSNGSKSPHNWSGRQYASDSSAERMKKHRAKKRDAGSDVTGDGSHVTSDAIEPETETETDTENKFFPSEQVTARKEGNELGFNFGLKNGRGKGETVETIAKRAEGLGLDAADLIGTTCRAKPKKPTAYMTALCVNRLKEQLPGLDEQILRDVLWGKPEHYATVCQMLLERSS